MLELVEKRTASSKTYSLGGRKFAVDAFIGAIHYKDALGGWQDIDATAFDTDTGVFSAQFTKLPYLVRVGNDSRRRIYPDRNDLSYWIELQKPFQSMGSPVKSGNVWVWDFANAQIKLTFGRGSVKFDTLLKNNQAPTSLTLPFSVQGITRSGNDLIHNGQVVARLRKPVATDANGVERDLTVTWQAGSVTVSLDTTGLAYPIVVDPTIDVSVAASTDDTVVYWDGAAWVIVNTHTNFMAGNAGAAVPKVGSGGHFLDVNVPVGATIDTAYIRIVAASSISQTIVNTVIIGEKSASPATFSTLANYQARRGTIVGGADDTQITVASVNWNGIATWMAGTTYNSPEIKTIIQEIVDLPGWVGDGTDDIVLHWDDYAGNSTTATAVRRGASWDNTTYDSPAVHIEYTSGYSWTVEALTEAEKVYCEAYTSGEIDTRRDITDEGDQAQIIADMKVAFPGSDTYYKHTHHHNNSIAPCVREAV